MPIVIFWKGEKLFEEETVFLLLFEYLRGSNTNLFKNTFFTFIYFSYTTAVKL